MNQATSASPKAAAAEETNVEEVAPFPSLIWSRFLAQSFHCMCSSPDTERWSTIVLNRAENWCLPHGQRDRPAKAAEQRRSAESKSATYQPQAVFSAGPCEIKDVLDDGFDPASIDMVGRYRLIEEVQTLPYRVVRAERLEDRC